MARHNAVNWRARLRRSLRQIGPMRLIATAIFLAFALYVARESWSLPLARDAERAMFDIRFFWTAPQAAQDERIVLVTYDDQTLQELGKRSPLDRRLLAEALRGIDTLGPRAIGIDILIDQAQPEDPLLVEAFRAMRTPTYLAFTTQEANERQIEYWQEQFLRDFIRRSSPVRAASIKLEPDAADNAIRRWPRQDPRLPPLLANALSPIHPEFRNYTRSIAFRLPESEEAPVFMNLPIQFVAANPEAVRPFIEGRYVLIGGYIQDIDDFETTLTHQTGATTKGIEVHAHILAQLLDGNMPAPIPGWALWVAAFGVVAAGGLTSLIEARGWKLTLVIAAQILFLAALPFYLQSGGIDTIALPAFEIGRAHV